MKKIYFLDENQKVITEYKDIDECLSNIIDEEFIVEFLNECYEPIEIPIIGLKNVGDIISAIADNDMSFIINDEIYYWSDEIINCLDVGEDYYDFSTGKISYSKEYLETFI